MFTDAKDVEAFLLMRTSFTISLLGLVAAGRKRVTAVDFNTAVARLDKSLQSVGAIDCQVTSWQQWGELWQSLLQNANVSEDKLKEFVTHEAERLKQLAKEKAENKQTLAIISAEAVHHASEEKRTIATALGKSVHDIMVNTCTAISGAEAPTLARGRVSGCRALGFSPQTLRV